MKKIIFFLLLAGVLGNNAAAQDCNCKKEFDFVKNYIERNYAGFADKLQLYTRAAYSRHNARLAAKLVYAKKTAHCFYLISQLLEFFKDGHIQLGYHGNVELNDSATVKKLLAKAERIKITPVQLKALQAKKNVEGIYWFRDSSYKIALMYSPTAFRDYAAVILQSRSNMWLPGMIKFELKQRGENKFDCIFYYRDHHAQLPEYAYSKGVLNNGDWIKERVTYVPEATKEQAVVYSKPISDSTHYIRIGSFDPYFTHEIDSVFKTDSALLSRVPNLVLDLRGNGGGYDFAYSPIIPYLYTNPINTIGADVLATKDNAEAWKALLDNPGLPDETKLWVKKLVAAMQAKPGSLVSVADDEALILHKPRAYPQKIAILIDKGCASSTEQLLLAALQSKKVILMGQPTAGVLDYANMRNKTLPCLPYTLSYATTRSRRVPEQAIDNKGIQPSVVLNRDADWVLAAQQYMEQ